MDVPFRYGEGGMIFHNGSEDLGDRGSEEVREHDRGEESDLFYESTPSAPDAEDDEEDEYNDIDNHDDELRRGK